MDYRYTLDVMTETGRMLERAVVTPDWKAALEWTHFEGIREGALPAVTRTGPGEVEPVWDAHQGEPWVSGFRVTVRTGEGSVATRQIPKAYLRRIALEMSTDLIKRRELEPGSTFRWVVSALPAPGGAAPATAGGALFAVGELARPLPVDESTFASFADDAVFASADDEAGGHVPVFFRRAVLDEATALAAASGDLETGGVLVGKLHRDGGPRDGGRPVMFVEVTAQVPAPHTRSSSTTLTFTAETWAAVRAAIALRGRNEVMAGWWHNHLDWCRLRNCPLERRRQCSAANPFFSAEDVHLHATCFPAGYQVALLVSDSAAAGGLTSSVFGWWEGLVVPRGFHVLGGERAVRTTEVQHGASTAA